MLGAVLDGGGGGGGGGAKYGKNGKNGGKYGKNGGKYGKNGGKYGKNGKNGGKNGGGALVVADPDPDLVPPDPVAFTVKVYAVLPVSPVIVTVAPLKVIVPALGDIEPV